MHKQTLSALISSRSVLRDKGITFIEDSNREEFISYRDLYELSLQALAFFQSRGLKKGDQLIIQTGDNKSLLLAFWASILGGIIPVPVSMGRTDNHIEKVFSIWSSLDMPFLFVSEDRLARFKKFSKDGLESIFGEMNNRLVEEGNLFSCWSKGNVELVTEEDTAYIQFSSGSTGSPKGVILSHNNILSNISAIAIAARYNSGDSTLSWMPLSHDMGLIGFHINPMLSSMNQFIVSTDAFIRRPSIWLEKAETHRVSILCSPNFGYHYLLKHIVREKEIKLDLSNVRLIYNGAEPISINVCREFTDFFSNYGLRATALKPVYGLAEASLAVCISSLNEEASCMYIDRENAKEGDTVRIAAVAKEALSVVNVGRCIAGLSLKISDSEGNDIPDQMIGRILIKGNSVTKGYYNNPVESQKIISNEGWLDTGDLGFVDSENLYVTGRRKDVLFVNGKNYYSHDIEREAQKVEGIELNKVVVAGYFNPDLQMEESIAFVFHRSDSNSFLPLARKLKSSINSSLGFLITKIVPVREIPRTTSGKLQRYKLVDLYRKGLLSSVEIESPEQTDIERYDQEDDIVKEFINTCRHVLSNKNINLNNNFFESGGNSLRAIEFQMALRAKFNVDVPIEYLYTHGNLSDILSRLISVPVSASICNPSLIPRGYNQLGYHDVSIGQSGIYHFCQAHKESTSYNISFAFDIFGELNVCRLERCLKDIIDNHDSYRMSFHMLGRPTFKINKEIDFTIEEIEFAGAELDDLLKSLILPFDLSKPPLFRFKLIRCESGSTVLFGEFHHIISDGISVYNFINLLMRLYHSGDSIRNPLQYIDYCHWKNGQLSTDALRLQEAFWKSGLQGSLPDTYLPYDFDRPAVFDPAGDCVNFSIDGEILSKMRSIARNNDCSLQVVMLSVFSTFLWAYGNRPEILFGIPVSSRTHPELIDAHGLFVNSLPVRININASDTFNWLLAYAKKTMANVLANQEFPANSILQQLKRKSNTSRASLFDTMFNYHNMLFSGQEVGGLNFRPRLVGRTSSKFDFSLDVFEEATRLSCVLEYSTGLFKRQTVQQFVGDFKTIINTVIADEATSIGAINLPWKQATCEYYGRTASDFSDCFSVADLFEIAARENPGSPAIKFADRVLTYSELNIKSDFVSRFLSGKLKGNQVVAIYLPRSPELIVVLMGVLKAGGCLLPIDINTPEERLYYMLESSDCSIVLTDKIRDDLTKRKDETRDFYCIETIEAESASFTDIEKREVDMCDLAYIIFTSGSTGYPKGVMVEHKSLYNYIKWAKGKYLRDSCHTFAFYTSISFDLTLTSIFLPLATGNRIVIYPETSDPTLINEIIRDGEADIIKITPSHLSILSESNNHQNIVANVLSCLIVGGEQLTRKLAGEIRVKFGEEVIIYNEYGPTEATIGCMIYEFDKQDLFSAVPIGGPISNVQIHILDSSLNTCPPGITGEIYIGGACLSRGYVNNKVLTEERFISNPFENNSRLYKTGDFARRLLDGRILYVGRQDNQIKRRGFRIELSEISQTIARYAGISDAAVLVNKNILEAFYCLSDQAADSFDLSKLLLHLRNSLPHYMIPDHFRCLEVMPLTVNGKIDTKALLALEPIHKPKNLREPANNIEKISLDIWREVLSCPELTVSDDFYEAGGDSIKAVLISSKLASQNILCEVKYILLHHTIQDISAYCKTSNERIAGVGNETLLYGERQFSAIETWFFSQEFEDAGRYNQYLILDLRATPNITQLKKAFSVVIDAHDGLRSNYNLQKKVAFYNPKHVGLDIEIAETELNVEYLEKSGSSLGLDYSIFIRHEFDLAKDFLLKIRILKYGDRYSLIIIAHHLVIDGISWRILLEDLFNIYSRLEKSAEAGMIFKTTSAKRVRQLVADRLTIFSMDNDFWKTQTNFALNLADNFDQSAWIYKNAKSLVAVLPSEATLFLLSELHKAYNLDMMIVVNATLVMAFHDWANINGVTIFQESHGRDIEGVDLSRTIGWFTVMYPLHFEITNESTQEILLAVKEKCRTVPNNGHSYGELGYLNKDRLMVDSIPDIRVNYLGNFIKDFGTKYFSVASDGFGSDISDNNTMTAKFDFNMYIVNSELNIDLTYNHKIIPHGEIDRLLAIVINKLSLIVDHLRSQEDIQLTPSDFPGINLEESDIKALFE